MKKPEKKDILEGEDFGSLEEGLAYNKACDDWEKYLQCLLVNYYIVPKETIHQIRDLSAVTLKQMKELK